MNPLPLHHYLVVGAALFCLGAIGFLARRADFGFPLELKNGNRLVSFLPG